MSPIYLFHFSVADTHSMTVLFASPPSFASVWAVMQADLTAAIAAYEPFAERLADDRRTNQEKEAIRGEATQSLMRLAQITSLSISLAAIGEVPDSTELVVGQAVLQEFPGERSATISVRLLAVYD